MLHDVFGMPFEDVGELVCRGPAAGCPCRRHVDDARIVGIESVRNPDKLSHVDLL